MKYIIFKQNDLVMPVVFPDHITHSQIKIENAKPISAGFLNFESGLPIAYGESESLNLRSSPMDSMVLTRLILNMGTAYFLDFDETD